MRMAILVQLGATTTRRIVLKGGQVAKFGRTEWADFTFAEDSQMSELHFAIQCGMEAGSLQALSPQHPTLVNEVPVEKTRLKNGDVIRAGRTTFLVQLEDIAMPVESPQATSDPSSASDKDANPEETLALAKYIGLSEASIELSGQCARPEMFSSILVEQRLLDDALRWHAHMLPKPQAILWACGCVEGKIKEDPSDLQRNSWMSALQWANEPTEVNRRQAAGFAEAAKYEGVGGIIAAAAAWSGGSLAEEDLPPVLPDERLTGRAIHLSLKLAANSTPAPLAERQLGFLSCLPKQSSTRNLD